MFPMISRAEELEACIRMLAAAHRSLFFTLRKVEMRELVAQAVEGKTKELLKKASRKSDRVMEKVDLTEMFGIDLEPDAASIIYDPVSEWPQEVVAPAATPKRAKNRQAEPVGARRKGRPRKTSDPAARRKDREKRSSKTAADAVFEVIRRSRNGIGVVEICRRTGFEERKVRNLIFRLRKTNRIKSLSWGVYTTG